MSLHDREDILFINFESLVYDYDNAVSQVASFCGVSKHSKKGEFLKPHRSVNNTQAFKKFKGFESDIELISEELKEYLFPFEKYPEVEAIGGMFHVDKEKKK